MDRLKDRVRELTKRTRGDSLACIIGNLNPVLRGWFGYFKHAHRGTFRAIDGFVRRRLRALLLRQRRRTGFGNRPVDHERWPNAFFAAAGLFALQPAWQTARHPR
jgi:RNA-directed DNA polymerase